MDIKATLLILLNLVLIESLLAISPAWALGTFTGRLSKENSNKFVVFTFVGFQLLKVVLFLFFYYFFSVWSSIIVASIVISVIGFIPFKKRLSQGIIYILLFLMVASILAMTQPFMGYYDSIPYPFNCTTNWYLIGFSYVTGIVVFWVILLWSSKRSTINGIVYWGGFFMLGLIVLDSIFSDFIFPILFFRLFGILSSMRIERFFIL